MPPPPMNAPHGQADVFDVARSIQVALPRHDTEWSMRARSSNVKLQLPGGTSAAANLSTEFNAGHAI